MAVLLAASVAMTSTARAADGPPGGQGAGAGAAGGGKDNKAMQPEEDDFSTTPFTEYGEFNEEAEEDADTKFFQYGRFFGVSIGLGFETLDGNRGQLWQGGFPMIDFKVHYWFDFNFALDLGLFTSSHFFESSTTNGGHVDVNMIHFGADVKYYFDTKNLASALSFSNPYLLVGFGSFTKTQNSFSQGTTDQDSSAGLSFGAGLEFTLKPRKAYFEVEGKMHIVTFKDTSTTLFKNSNNLDNLNGNFYTVTGNVLFTW